MITIFLDFDNTIVKSNKKIIEMVNGKYNLNKTEADLTDFGYRSIYPMLQSEVIDLYRCDEFFNNLELKEGALDIISKYRDKYDIAITTVGSFENLKKKSQWIINNLPSEVRFIGIESSESSKGSINMDGAIQIDDTKGSLDTNASLKILYKDGNNYDWQQLDPCEEILLVNAWSEIGDILEFCLVYDYKTLNRR